MTTTTADLTTTETAATDTPAGTCWECGGPCLTYKGNEHGWRCRACLAAHIEHQVQLGDARETKERAKRLAKFRAAADKKHRPQWGAATWDARSQHGAASH